MRNVSPALFPLLGNALKAARYEDWKNPQFSLKKSLLCCVLSELVYHHVPGWEVGGQNRMWMVPCLGYRQIVRSGNASSIEPVLDEFGIESLILDDEENNTIAVIARIPRPEVIIVALRGTSGFYDLMLDLKFPLKQASGVSAVGKVHKGFNKEAVIRHADMMTRLKVWGDPNVPVYFTGHSLGGAISAIMQISHMQLTANSLFSPKSAYIYGTPRYGDSSYLHSAQSEPFSFLRQNDPVPSLPPKFLGYADGLNESNELAGRAPVRRRFSFFRLPSHKIERYRKSIEKGVRCCIT